jgi:hypothetical protein
MLEVPIATKVFTLAAAAIIALTPVPRGIMPDGPKPQFEHHPFETVIVYPTKPPVATVISRYGEICHDDNSYFPIVLPGEIVYIEYGNEWWSHKEHHKKDPQGQNFIRTKLPPEVAIQMKEHVKTITREGWETLTDPKGNIQKKEYHYTTTTRDEVADKPGRIGQIRNKIIDTVISGFDHLKAK